MQCYLQDIDLELAALEEGNRNRQAELSAYAELDNIAEEDEQEPPGWLIPSFSETRIDIVCYMQNN